mgnify:FL=1
MEPIEVQSLSKDYGHGCGVFHVCLSVHEGEVFGFLGANGAGKSTTIRHLMGFSKPDEGQALLFGRKAFENYADVMNRVGYLPGEIALPAGLTGWDFIDMMKELRGTDCDENTQRLMRMFDLDPSGETKRMSLGVKRKLAVVTAFMHDPDVLILDEPTSGLDIVMQETFIDFIKEEKRRGKTILLSSHIFSEVDATCDRIAIIKDGRIVSDFIADDLRHNSNKNYDLIFTDQAAFDTFAEENQNNPHFRIVEKNREALRLLVNVDDAQINALIRKMCGSGILEFHHRRETLEEYFMQYYKEDMHFGGVV